MKLFFFFSFDCYIPVSSRKSEGALEELSEGAGFNIFGWSSDGTVKITEVKLWRNCGVTG